MTTAANVLMEVPQMLPMRPILVFENDKAMLDELERLFESDRHAVDIRTRGAARLQQSWDVAPSAFVLRFQIAEDSARRLLEHIRQANPCVPIIVLGAPSSDIEGILSGVVMPFNRGELLARIGSVIRRIEGESGNDFAFGEVHVDFRRMEVRRKGEVVSFTALEFKLLKFMIHNPERILSRDELLNEVWGYRNYPTTRTVDNQILKLRRKLEPCPSRPVHFLTFHGAGYKFVPSVAPPPCWSPSRTHAKPSRLAHLKR